MVITVSSDNITVEMAPIKTCQSKTLLLTNDTREVCCKRHVKQGEQGQKPWAITYDVHIVETNNVRTKIVGYLHSMETALYIQQEIQRFLFDEETSRIPKAQEVELV